MSAPSEATVVFGIPVAQPRTAMLVRKVMIVSMVMATAAVVNTSIQIAAGAFGGVAVLIALAIPACGYYGAKARDPRYLQWFWQCNACCSCLNFFAAIVSISTINSIACICDGSCIDTTSTSSSVETILSRCHERESLERELWLAVILYMLDGILQAIGCTWGRALSESDLMFEPPPHMGDVPVAAVATVVQPGRVDVVPRRSDDGYGGGGYGGGGAAATGAGGGGLAAHGSGYNFGAPTAQAAYPPFTGPDGVPAYGQYGQPPAGTMAGYSAGGAKHNAVVPV